MPTGHYPNIYNVVVPPRAPPCGATVNYLFKRYFPMTESTFSRIKTAINRGLGKGWKGLVWLLKILVPISFATALLVYFGIIYKLDFLLTPAMNILALPAFAALPLIIGLLTGIYGAVAALAVMPFSTEHMTLIAIFLLISHNLIQESIVQGKSGINPFFVAFSRLVVSFLVTFFCAKIMGVTPETIVADAAGNISHNNQAFLPMLQTWSISITKLGLQIFCIIMPLMVVLELAKEFKLIIFLTKMIAPVLKIMGLDRSTGMLWLTASVFGLTYGSAVIVEETKSNKFAKEELIRLHLSIGINHAMIEDPVLFLPLGLPVVWLCIPRIIAAMIATYLYNFFILAKRLKTKQVVNKEFL